MLIILPQQWPVQVVSFHIQVVHVREILEVEQLQDDCTLQDDVYGSASCIPPTMRTNSVTICSVTVNT